MLVISLYQTTGREMEKLSNLAHTSVSAPARVDACLLSDTQVISAGEPLPCLQSAHGNVIHFHIDANLASAH